MSDESQDIAPEQAADLARLRAAAEGAETLPTGEGGAVAVVPNPAQEIAIALRLVVQIAAPLYPSLDPIYSEEVCGRIGAAVVPVCIKYGINLDGGFFAKWGPEIGLLMVVGPLIPPTVLAMRTDTATREAARKARAQQQQQQAGARPEQVEEGAADGT